MKKEYAIYPFRVMNISQNWNQGNHVPHWQGSKNYSDKPWDEACKDSSRSYFEPQNDFLVEEVLGLNTNTTNSVRLKSVNKLYIPYKKAADYLYLTLTHMNEDNLKQVKKGQVLKKGSKLLLEGTDGYATGNHFHITANIGKYHGFLKNSNGSWCYTYDKSLLPEEAFYIDTSFTTIKNSNGSKFKNVPVDLYGTPVARSELVDQVEILATNVRARTMPSTVSGDVLGYMNSGIYNVDEIDIGDGYTWYEVDGVWFAFSTNWAKLLPKKESELPKTEVEEPKTEQNQPNVDDNASVIQKLLQLIIELLKKIFKS